MKKLSLCIVLVLLLMACKSKKKSTDDNAQFFPIVSFLKSQVAQIDTTLLGIKKLVKRDSTWDTTYIKREAFRGEVTDFLTIPDLTQKQYRGNFTETKLFDESLNKAILTYTPIEADEATRREEVVIQPDQENGDKVYSIFINLLFVHKDSIIQKNLYWQVDSHCDIITIAQQKGGKETIRNTRLIWGHQ
jgi:hypothetical protein